MKAVSMHRNRQIKTCDIKTLLSLAILITQHAWVEIVHTEDSQWHLHAVSSQEVANCKMSAGRSFIAIYRVAQKLLDTRCLTCCV